MGRKRDDDDDDRYEEEDRPRRKRRRDDDDDDDDRPRSRRRRDDDDDDEDDDRPRRRRRRRDDDDDLPARRKRPLTGLDAMYHDTSIVILVLFGFLCGLIAVVLSVVALVTCKDETAKRNATIVLIVSAIMAVLHAVSLVMRNAGRF